MNPIDTKGYESLKVIGKAGNFNEWMFETIAPFIKGNVLEIGSGTGNISEFVIRKGYATTLSDVDEFYLSMLKVKFSALSNVKDILSVDLQHPSFEHEYNRLAERFDSIFYLNVLEHLENEVAAIRNSRFLLRPGGRLIILVPAYSFLYSRMDKILNHYRRYTKARLNALLTSNQMEVIKSFYFNAAGIGAWLYGKLLKVETVPEGEMHFFNKIVPAAKMFDKVILKRAGLSVISISEKKFH